MKKYILKLTIASICVNSAAYAQTYREQFDKLNQLSSDEGKTSNVNGFLGSNCSRYMDANIMMYKATNDIRYLNQFIILSKRVMDRRNDNWNNIYNEMVDLPQISTSFGDCIALKLTNQVSYYAGWSRFNEVVETYPISTSHPSGDDKYNQCYLNATFMDSGMITYPMAAFILLMQEHSELNNTPLPLEALSSNLVSTNSYNGSPVLNFLDYANWLKQKVKETLNYELNTNYYFWGDFYFHLPGNPNDGYKAINQQCQIARTCLLMYLVSVNDGTNITDYRDVAEHTATQVYEAWNDPAIGSSIFTLSNGAPWRAWCHLPACQSGLWEDISHAYLEAELIKLMVDNNTLLHTSNGYDFNSGYLEKIANGFLYVMCAKPASVSMNVYGSDVNCNQACTDYIPTPALPPRHFYQSGHYVFLAEYNPGIYQAISDMYSPNQVSGGIQNLIFKNLDGNTGDVLFGLAQLCYYENLFNPITVKNGAPMSVPHIPTSVYTGSCVGDFDGNGTQEFASLNSITSNNEIRTYEIDNLNTISVSVSKSISGENKYLSAGNFINSTTEDELVSIDFQSQMLKIYKVQSGDIPLVSQHSTSSINLMLNDVRGISKGDFNTAYPGDEIIINSSLTGAPIFKMYSYDASGILIDIPISNNIIAASTIDGFCAGNFDISGENQIAIYENSSNRITIYKIATGNILQQVATGILNTPGEIWKGITSGDFDGDGIDEIMLYQENSRTGRFEIFRLTSIGVELKALEYFPKNQENGIMCCMRLPNYPQSDALVSFRSYDGQISIFNMDGWCPGLNLNNQNINYATTLGTVNLNYPLDYHVNSILVAGNNFNIVSPSIVEMSSGKEIIFKPGFTAKAGSDLHAYISPTLECNPSTFKRSPANVIQDNPQQYSSHPERIKTIVNANLGIAPNPNNGSFQITITRNEKTVSIKEIKVYNIMGKVIWENGASTNNTFNIDISAYSSGIYYVKCINEFDEIEIKKLIKQ